MTYPKHVESLIAKMLNEIDRLKRKVDRLIAEKNQLARELELATESWSDEQRDANKRKSFEE